MVVKDRRTKEWGKKPTTKQVRARQMNALIALTVRNVSHCKNKLKELQIRVDMNEKRNMQILNFFERFYRLYNISHKRQIRMGFAKLMTWLDSLINKKLFLDLKKIELEQKIEDDILKDKESINDNLDLVEEILKKDMTKE